MRSLDAALHGTGAACEAIDLIMQGKAANAFVPVRPPGHHATAGASHGFLSLQQCGGSPRDMRKPLSGN